MTLLSVLQRTLGKKIPTTKSCRLVQLNHLCWAPNITGENGTNIGDSGTPSGAFRRDSRVTGNGSGDGDQFRMGFDASRSNDIFGASAVVQPAALLLLPCIKT